VTVQRSSSMSSSPRRPGHRRPPAGAAADPVVAIEVGADLGVDPCDSGDGAPVSPLHIPDVLRFALYEHRRRARRERQVAKLACGSALLVLGVLTGLSWHGHIAAVDRAATTDMVQAKSSAVFTLANAVSVLGSGPVVAMIALIVGTSMIDCSNSGSE